MPAGKQHLRLGEQGTPVTRILTWLKRLCAVSLILLMQGPAMLMQEMAWASMLATYTRDRGLTRGVMETFDGRHPCKMCEKAADLRKQEGKESPGKPQRETKPIHFTWGEMLNNDPPTLPKDPGIDCPTRPLAAVPGVPGSWMESPMVPPPERV